MLKSREISIKKIVIFPGEFQITAKIIENIDNISKTTEETYLLHFNPGLKWHPYAIVCKVAENTHQKKGKDRKYLGEKLYCDLGKDEDYHKDKIYYLWKSPKYKKRIGNKTLFRLYRVLNNKPIEENDVDFRMAFAQAFLKTNNEKNPKKAEYWLGDYRTTKVEFRLKHGKIATTSIPLPPNRYAFRPYPMKKNFTGRTTEINLLNTWFEQNENPMFALIAIGGMGKSCLAWQWLEEEIIKQDKTPEGIIWWSFYEIGGEFENFVNNALTYVTSGESHEDMSLREKMDSLLQILQNKRFLLILDGVERILRHYVGLNAPYLSDEEPKGDDQSFRSCANPHEGTFLQNIANPCTKTRTLITSRLFPSDLENIKGCHKEELLDFSLEDTHRFFHREGIPWTLAEVERVCEPYGFLPLALSLLTGAILGDPLEPGDFVPNPKKIIPKIIAKSRHILEVAYSSLSPKEQKFLSSMAAFRFPMDYNALSHISSEDKETIREILSSLIGRNLVSSNMEKKTEKRTYDLHPIVRSYSYDKLEDKKGVHSKMKNYFSTLPEPQKISVFSDLADVIELYHHTLKSGDYDLASKLFKDRIVKHLFYSFGNYQACIAIIPDLLSGSDFIVDEDAKVWAINILTTSYSHSGQPGFSETIKDKINELSEKKNLAICLDYLARAQMALGELELAAKNLHHCLEIQQEIKDKREVYTRRELVRLYGYLGDFEGVEREFNLSIDMFNDQEIFQSQCVAWEYLSGVTMFKQDYSRALEAANKAHEIASKYEHKRDVASAEWLLGAAYRGLGQLDKAETHLNKALNFCLSIRLEKFETAVLLDLARLYHDQSKENAFEFAHKALKIADRCKYRLNQADIHLFLAQLALENEDKAKAHTEAGLAIDFASCGYKPALEAAQGLVLQLDN